MILSETFILACFPWVLLRSTHGYKEMMPCGQLCPLRLCDYLWKLMAENCQLTFFS